MLGAACPYSCIELPGVSPKPWRGFSDIQMETVVPWSVLTGSVTGSEVTQDTLLDASSRVFAGTEEGRRTKNREAPSHG